MLAMLGMYVQALVTGKGPVSNWLEHLADPSSANGFAFATKFAPTLLARLIAAGLRSSPPSAPCRCPSQANRRVLSLVSSLERRMPAGSGTEASPRKDSGPRPSHRDTGSLPLPR